MRRWLLAVLMGVGCGGPTIPAGSVEGGADGAGVGSGGGDGGGGDTGVEQLPGAPGPWLRDRVESPGPVTFNEVQFHPRDGQGGEWIELHNPRVLDVDLGNWRLSGAVDFTFPRGTRIAAGGFLAAVCLPRLLRVVRLGQVTVGALAGGAPALLLLALADTVAVAVIGLIGWGLARY